MKEMLIAKINEGISERNAIALATRFDSPALDGIQNRLNEMVKELEKLTGEKWVINLDAVERVLATDGMKRLKCKKVCGEWYYVVNKYLAEPYILYGVNGLSAGEFETYADMKSFIDDEGECIKEMYSRPLWSDETAEEVPAEVTPVEPLEEAPTNTLYFINSDVNPDTIYGSEMPCCITKTEIDRLAAEWEYHDLMDRFHEASAEEIAEYGA